MGGIVLALILLLCYMFRKHSPGRWALAAITAVFYLLSIEPVSNGLIHPLETAYDQPQGADVDGDVIILLGGGSRAGVPDFDGTGQVGSAAANRFLMALRLQKAKDLPILLSGGIRATPMNRKSKSGCSYPWVCRKIRFSWMTRAAIRQKMPLFPGKSASTRAGRSPSWSPAPSICPGRSASLRAKAWT